MTTEKTPRGAAQMAFMRHQVSTRSLFKSNNNLFKQDSYRDLLPLKNQRQSSIIGRQNSKSPSGLTPITTRSRSNIQPEDFNFEQAAEAVFGSHQMVEDTPCFPPQKQATLKQSANQLITPKSMKNANYFVGRLDEIPIVDKNSQAADDSIESLNENAAKLTRIDSGSGLNQTQNVSIDKIDLLLSPSHTQFSSVRGSTDRRYESNSSAFKSGESSKRSKAITKKPKEVPTDAKMNNGKQILIGQDGQKIFKCGICGAEYSKSVALGGHQSKAHPGTSSSYKRKLEIRQSREEERKLLERAKDWFVQNMYLCPENNRKIITAIKKVLKEGGEPNVRDYLENVS